MIVTIKFYDINNADEKVNIILKKLREIPEIQISGGSSSQNGKEILLSYKEEK